MARPSYGLLDGKGWPGGDDTWPARFFSLGAGTNIIRATTKPIANAVGQPRGIAAIRTSNNRAFQLLNRCRTSVRRAAMPRYALPCTLAREAR